jgi:hypothetical protein
VIEQKRRSGGRERSKGEHDDAGGAASVVDLLSSSSSSSSDRGDGREQGAGVWRRPRERAAPQRAKNSKVAAAAAADAVCESAFAVRFLL